MGTSATLYSSICDPYWFNDGLRRWPIIKPTSCQCVVFAVFTLSFSFPSSISRCILHGVDTTTIIHVVSTLFLVKKIIFVSDYGNVLLLRKTTIFSIINNFLISIEVASAIPAQKDKNRKELTRQLMGRSNPFKPEFTICHLHPLQAANCCRNSRLVVNEVDLKLKWVTN